MRTVLIKATPHKARLTALHAICVQIFRHIAQKSLAIRQYACGISMQSAEKSDYASYAQALFSVSQGKKQKKHAVSNENCVLFDFQMLLGKRKSVSIMRGEDSGVYRQ